jgi:hypothetical protein
MENDVQPGNTSDGTFGLGMPVRRACCDTCRCCWRPTSGNFTDADKIDDNGNF